MRPELFSATSICDGSADLLALVAAHQGEPLFYMERRGLTVAGVGSAAEIVSTGPRRFVEASREALALLFSIRSAGGFAADRLVLGGFAFSDEPRTRAEWREFPPLRLFVPRLLWIREAGQCRFTRTWAAGSPETGQKAPAPSAAATAGIELKSSANPRERELWRRRVECACNLIAAGALNKVVAARRIELFAAGRIDPAPLVA
ncbi:MAG: hypothetical protein WA005_15605, partial [Candidatus Binataceae bacterium]